MTDHRLLRARYIQEITDAHQADGLTGYPGRCAACGYVRPPRWLDVSDRSRESATAAAAEATAAAAPLDLPALARRAMQP